MAAGSMPGMGIKVPKRATISAPSVKKMRWRSSWALPRLPKLKLAASCSAADAIFGLHRRARSLTLARPALYIGSGPPLARRAGKQSLASGVAVAGLALGGGIGAALLAFARLAFFVAIDRLLEGCGAAPAGLFDRFAGASR